MKNHYQELRDRQQEEVNAFPMFFAFDQRQFAEGMRRLGWSVRPKAIHELQAAAAVGQMGLVQAYEAAFGTFGLKTAQVLLTHEDLADRRRYLIARSTLPSAWWGMKRRMSASATICRSTPWCAETRRPSLAC